jgi:hypothetical protein
MQLIGAPGYDEDLLEVTLLYQYLTRYSPGRG